jgi:hypothetical protein
MPIAVLGFWAKFLGNGICGKLLLPVPSGWELAENPTSQAVQFQVCLSARRGEML